MLGAHDIEGGANVLSKLLSDACRSYFTPKLSWRCAFRDGYDSCDPDQTDVCFLRESHFTAGRFVERGYRFAHLVRAPIDVLTRSFLLAEPNATRLMNATLLVNAHAVPESLSSHSACSTLT